MNAPEHAIRRLCTCRTYANMAVSARSTRPATIASLSVHAVSLRTPSPMSGPQTTSITIVAPANRMTPAPGCRRIFTSRTVSPGPPSSQRSPASLVSLSVALMVQRWVRASATIQSPNTPANMIHRPTPAPFNSKSRRKATAPARKITYRNQSGISSRRARRRCVATIPTSESQSTQSGTCALGSSALLRSRR